MTDELSHNFTVVRLITVFVTLNHNPSNRQALEFTRIHKYCITRTSVDYTLISSCDISSAYCNYLHIHHVYVIDKQLFTVIVR